jgi:hypothetical protein
MDEIHEMAEKCGISIIQHGDQQEKLTFNIDTLEENMKHKQ